MKLSERLRDTRRPPAAPDDRLHARPRPDRSPADAVGELKARAHEALFARLGVRLFDSTLTQEQLHAYVATEIGELMATTTTAPLSAAERQRLVDDIIHDVVGLGPIERFLADPTVTEVMVNSTAPIYVERSGVIEQTDSRFVSEDHLRRVIERIVGQVGRRIDESSPMVDARLADGSRVNAVIPPLSVDGPMLTIRKFARDPLQVDDLIALGTLTPAVADLVSACVDGGLNVLVSGGTGTGKTTMLNVLSSFIPEDERIVTIEDAVELQLRQRHVVRLESRPPNIEGRGEVTIRDLVRNSLRMRPDRIIVGEVRGAEALDMLQAMNTGHDGSISTIHANTPRDALARLETMVLMAGFDLPSRAIREQIASALHLIVHLQRFRDGSPAGHAGDRGRRHGGRRHHAVGHLRLRPRGRRRPRRARSGARCAPPASGRRSPTTSPTSGSACPPRCSARPTCSPRAGGERDEEARWLVRRVLVVACVVAPGRRYRPMPPARRRRSTSSPPTRRRTRRCRRGGRTAGPAAPAIARRRVRRSLEAGEPVEATVERIPTRTSRSCWCSTPPGAWRARRSRPRRRPRTVPLAAAGRRAGRRRRASAPRPRCWRRRRPIDQAGQLRRSRR